MKLNWKRFLTVLAGLCLVITVIIIIANQIKYKDIVRSITIEAGSDVPEASQFLKNTSGAASYLTDITRIDVRHIGSNTLKIQHNGKIYTVRLKIQDTKPPKADSVEKTISDHAKLTAAECVANIQDETQVIATFKKEPPFGKLGDYDVTIVLKDKAGNMTEVLSKIHIAKVKGLVVMEAGSSLPSLKDFITDERDSAEFKTDFNEIVNNVPGTYDIDIAVENQTYRSKLEIKDTIAPTGVVKELDLYDSEIVEPEQFFDNISDATDVTVTYKNTPDFSKVNSQPVSLILQDTSGNKTEYQTSFRVSKLKKFIQIEASHEELDVKKLLKRENETGDVSLAGGAFKLNQVGSFPVKVAINDIIYDSVVEIVDTTAPTGTAENQRTWMGVAIEASAFVKEISDVTAVKVRFQEEPDIQTLGEKQVALILTDEGQNETTLTALLTVEKDVTPPKINVAKKRTVYIGQPVSYKKDVYAVDDKDGEVPVTVDSSQVNVKVEGEYKVIYTATDSSGNTATEEVTLTVKIESIDMEELNKLADEVLAKITTENMSLREKAWEIYQYVNKHVKYNGMSDKTDWMKEAYYGITKGVGDCFTYYAVSHLLLNRLGIPTLSVERLTKPGEARHYWHMINCGDGWYHFDACIHKPPLVSFMLTDAELDAYSARVGKDNYYYRYDRTNYPATPEK